MSYSQVILKEVDQLLLPHAVDLLTHAPHTWAQISLERDALLTVFREFDNALNKLPLKHLEQFPSFNVDWKFSSSSQTSLEYLAHRIILATEETHRLADGRVFYWDDYLKRREVVDRVVAAINQYRKLFHGSPIIEFRIYGSVDAPSVNVHVIVSVQEFMLSCLMNDAGLKTWASGPRPGISTPILKHFSEQVKCLKQQ